MSKREDHKIVELAGRKWRIEKFDALTGCYIAYKVMGQVLPMGMDALVKGEAANTIVPGPKLPVMSRQEFTELQFDCLGVCYEVLPAGKAPVIGENGAWGVAGLENDTVTVMTLTVHALIFNISSFFDGNALKDLTASFSGTTLFGALISKNLPTPQ
ncbi:phage tail assembly chaperone [Sporomusa sp. KB1]|jgi:hypothetical protein|uniref:phage tail assembly chaperone n=1 Tax=Sporomusa sp. KB1 TaxID=943346 RepID=UPI00119D072F|nr:hypothetical protein [Sporomusa sp. KB1]TWH46331.1 hypothetical protein Salpa_2312 [Sporomusa sp. KB1]